VTAVGDAIYIGGDAFPDGLSFTIGTAGDYDDITLVWQYWDGDSWKPLTVTLDETNLFETAGTELRVEWDKPSDCEPSGDPLRSRRLPWGRRAGCFLRRLRRPVTSTSLNRTHLKGLEREKD